MNNSIIHIGIIQSPLKNLEDCPLQEHEDAPEVDLIIFPEFMQGVADIKPGDDVIILTWMHQADRNELKTHPRNNSEAPLTGVFSTRSPNRPNPIGLHQVKILTVSGNTITVSALEVLDGTPIVDIKPAMVKPLI